MIHGYISEYKDHKCAGYNIQANFYNNEKYIVSGSEDHSIYIYDKNNLSIRSKIKTKTKVNHLVKPIPRSESLSIAFSGL